MSHIALSWILSLAVTAVLSYVYGRFVLNGVPSPRTVPHYLFGSPLVLCVAVAAVLTDMFLDSSVFVGTIAGLVILAGSTFIAVHGSLDARDH